MCSVAEKMSAPFRLRVRGRSGHASMPGIADNALVKAAPLITALGEYVPEQRLIPEVEALLEAVTGARPATPQDALEQARGIGEVEPDAKPAPICVAGFTDSHWFREAFGTVAYGFFPSRAMSPELAARLIHSADERIPVEDLELGVSFLRYAAQAMVA